MFERATSTVNAKTLAMAQDAKSGRIWCEVCGSDEYIFIERARWRRRQGDGSWDIDYTCTKCDSFYGHLVKDADVTPALMAAMAVARDGAHNDPLSKSP